MCHPSLAIKNWIPAVLAIVISQYGGLDGGIRCQVCAICPSEVLRRAELELESGFGFYGHVGGELGVHWKADIGASGTN